jgi:hypothetical protein
MVIRGLLPRHLYSEFCVLVHLWWLNFIIEQLSLKSRRFIVIISVFLKTWRKYIYLLHLCIRENLVNITILGHTFPPKPHRHRPAIFSLWVCLHRRPMSFPLVPFIPPTAVFQLSSFLWKGSWMLSPYILFFSVYFLLLCLPNNVELFRYSLITFWHWTCLWKFEVSFISFPELNLFFSA